MPLDERIRARSLDHPEFLVGIRRSDRDDDPAAQRELANQRLIFQSDEDVHVLKGRCQALSQVLIAIDTVYKEQV